MSFFRRLINKFFGAKQPGTPSEVLEVEINPYRHQPHHFGYKSSWYVVRTENTEEVAKCIKELANTSLRVSLFRVPGWSVNISSAYQGWVFLICGLEPDSIGSLPDFKTFLVLLSERFGEAQFFGTHRVVEYHCWANAVNGKLVRFYSFVGEIGENIDIEGEPTEAERKFNLVNTLTPEAKTESYFETPGLVIPDEDLVMEIADSWSCNPTKFSTKNFEDIWAHALTVHRTK